MRYRSLPQVVWSSPPPQVEHLLSMVLSGLELQIPPPPISCYSRNAFSLWWWEGFCFWFCFLFCWCWWWVFVVVIVCVCARVRVFRCMDMVTWVWSRGQTLMSFFRSSSPYFWAYISHLALDFRLGETAREPKNQPVSTSPLLRLLVQTQTCRFWELNSTSWAYEENMLATELFPGSGSWSSCYTRGVFVFALFC